MLFYCVFSSLLTPPGKRSPVAAQLFTQQTAFLTAHIPFHPLFFLLINICFSTALHGSEQFPTSDASLDGRGFVLMTCKSRPWGVLPHSSHPFIPCGARRSRSKSSRGPRTSSKDFRAMLLYISTCANVSLESRAASSDSSDVAWRSSSAEAWLPCCCCCCCCCCCLSSRLL